jgi:divalent metal cation (Fe/Co/Zn/Cd) transporter
MQRESGERTLRASVLLSAPGPLVLGMALFYGRSSTQLADFIRRTAELAAIVVSWMVYRRLAGEPDAAHRSRLERTARLSVGAAMCLSGAAMAFVALYSPGDEQGNVLPAFVIAALGLAVNGYFWLRYRRLNKQTPDAILDVQSRLYRAKTLVDGCVAAALTVVALSPGTPAARAVDLGGSLVVAAYLFLSGLSNLKPDGSPSRP